MFWPTRKNTGLMIFKVSKQKDTHNDDILIKILEYH